MDDSGQVGRNHWSQWVEDNSGGCIMPRISEERAEARRAWFAKHFPDYTWPTVLTIDVEAPDGSAEAIGAAIVEAVRKSHDKRV